MKFRHKTNIDDAIKWMADNGMFLDILDQNLRLMDYVMSDKDKQYFQREFVSVASSYKRPYSEKINVIQRLIEDTVEAIEKVIELSAQRNDQNRKLVESRVPPCLTSKRKKFKKPVLDKNTHTEKKSLKEIKWLRDSTGKIRGYIRVIGPRVVLSDRGGKLLGFYLPNAGPKGGITFDYSGKNIGFGNQLAMLLQASS